MPKDPTFENALAFAQELVRIPSLSGKEGEVAHRVLLEMEDLGYDETWTDELGNAVGIIRGQLGGPPVMLNCHMDVVAEGDHGAWEYPPFSGVVDGGFLHGRGSMDIKGPLAIQTYAAAALRGRAPGDVVVAHTVFEERGGWGMEHLMESKRVEPRAVIIGEATRGDITIGHRGRAEVEVVLHGLAAHASAPERGLNPLDLVPAALTALRDLASRQEEDAVLGEASLVATGVDVSPESRNVIPDRVVVVGDWRVLPDNSHETLLGRVEEVVGRHLSGLPEGMRWEVRMAKEVQEAYTGLREERDLFTPGFLVDPQDPLVLAGAKAVGRRHDAGLPGEIRPWTFATDGGWSCGVFGVPTIGFAPGEERYAHTNRERLDVDETRWAFARYPQLILAMQAALV
ncbi:M20/M25/M40 family metallo-hydrolase [Gemmatimonadota bacterium]